MSRVVSLRLKDQQMERLQRAARRLGRTPSETAALLVDEAMRQLEFAQIEFRDSIVGRQAYVRGSSMAVWEVARLADSYAHAAEGVAGHLDWPVPRVLAALAYATAFPGEIQQAIEDNSAYDFARISRMLPEAVRFPSRKRASSAAR